MLRKLERANESLHVEAEAEFGRGEVAEWVDCDHGSNQRETKVSREPEATQFFARGSAEFWGPGNVVRTERSEGARISGEKEKCSASWSIQNEILDAEAGGAFRRGEVAEWLKATVC